MTITPTLAAEEERHTGDDGRQELERGGGGGGPPSEVGVLRLRGGPVRRGPRVQWEEGTVDNEFLNRKKSKSESEERLMHSSCRGAMIRGSADT